MVYSNSRLKILFLSAGPVNLMHLRLGKEFSAIQEKINSSNYSEKFILSNWMAAKPSDITQALLKYCPNIVHFSGHGLSTGELCFENDLGEMETVSPKILEDLFDLISDRTKCVILNSCDSKILAEAIAKHISYVIGMSQGIEDRTAIAFSIGFYQALGSGYSIKQAFKFGRIEIELRNMPGSNIPELFTKEKIDNSKIPKIQWKLVLEGTFDSTIEPTIDRIIDYLSELLQAPELKLKKIEQGSIKIFLECSQENFEIFKELFESGRLKELLGIPIKNVHSSKAKILTSFDEKREIRLDEQELQKQTGDDRSSSNYQNQVLTQTQTEDNLQQMDKVLTNMFQRNFTSPEFRVYQTAVFIDMVDATEIKEQTSEPSWLHDLGWLYDLIIRVVNESEGGQVIKFTGDGAFIVFNEDNVTDAINAVIRMQEEIAAARDENQIRFACSVGVATGDMVEFRINENVVDYAGTTVDRASRLSAAANSQAIFADIKTIDDAQMRKVVSNAGKSANPKRKSEQYKGSDEKIKLKGFSGLVQYYELLWSNQRYGVASDFVTEQAEDEQARQRVTDPPQSPNPSPPTAQTPDEYLDPNDLFQLAIQEFQSEKFQSAIEKFSILAERGFSEAVDAIFRAGQFFYQRGEHQNALGCFQYAASKGHREAISIISNNSEGSNTTYDLESLLRELLNS